MTILKDTLKLLLVDSALIWFQELGINHKPYSFREKIKQRFANNIPGDVESLLGKEIEERYKYDRIFIRASQIITAILFFINPIAAITLTAFTIASIVTAKDEKYKFENREYEVPEPLNYTSFVKGGAITASLMLVAKN